jgi:integrase
MPRPITDYHAQRITKELIRRLANAVPPEKPREIRDRSASLILRHQPSGYLGLYANLGRGKRERLCDASRIIDSSSKWTLSKARVDARRLKVQHSDGRDFSAERKAGRAIPTLEEFLDETYGPWLKANRRSGAETLRKLDRVADSLGKRKIIELTPVNLEPWRAKRQREVAAETVNKDISALRAALSRAVRWEIITRNPLLGIETAEVDRHRRVVRALTASEKTKLYAALKARDDKKRKARASANRWRKERSRKLLPDVGRYADVLTPAVIVSLETGLRRGELFQLEWPSVDLGEKTKTLRVKGTTAKTYETRDIPLNDTAHKTLRGWWLQRGQPKSGLVFTLDGEQIGSLKKSYYAVLEAAAIKRVNAKGERINWHSLRHTFGSLLGAAGADPTTLMTLMGHANLSTTQRYLHTDEDRKRAAVELLTKAMK